MYDLMIIGAGPAGMAAGFTAAKLKINTLVVTKEISKPEPAGKELVEAGSIAQEFAAAAKQRNGTLELHDKTEIIGLEKNVVSFAAEDKRGKTYYARCVIVATGCDEKTGEGRTGFENRSLKDALGKIKVDANMRSSLPGLLAAGDANNAGGGSILVAAGEGAKAVLAAAVYLSKKKS